MPVKKYTPPFGPDRHFAENPGSVFVFGSNLAGVHGGGAAATALKKYGAVLGQGFGYMSGPTGISVTSYGIPTKGYKLHTLSYTEIAFWVDKFNNWVLTHGQRFTNIFVTKIGCGLAGYTEEQIAPLFRQHYWPNNVTLPIGW